MTTRPAIPPPLFQARPLGDCAVRVALGEAPDPDTQLRLRRFCAWLASASLPGVAEWVPAYTSVTVFYAPEQIGYEALCQALRQGAWDRTPAPMPPGKLVELPVRYGGADGPDLAPLAARHGLSVLQVVALHAGPVL